MRLAPQFTQMISRFGPVGRLVEEPVLADQHLVGPENQPSGEPRADSPGLQLGQGAGDVARGRALGLERLLDRGFVNAGGHNLEGHTRGRQ